MNEQSASASARQTARESYRSIAEFARGAPGQFDALAAMRLAVLFAARRGSFHRLHLETQRSAGAVFEDVAGMDLDGDPRLEFTFGIHSTADWLHLRDGPPGLTAAERQLADQVDVRMHRMRYALWLWQAYPGLAQELNLASLEDAAWGELNLPGAHGALEPLMDAIHARTGLPIASPAAKAAEFPPLPGPYSCVPARHSRKRCLSLWTRRSDSSLLIRQAVACGCTSGHSRGADTAHCCWLATGPACARCCTWCGSSPAGMIAECSCLVAAAILGLPPQQWLAHQLNVHVFYEQRADRKNF
jgi:hypothetical protein